MPAVRPARLSTASVFLLHVFSDTNMNSVKLAAPVQRCSDWYRKTRQQKKKRQYGLHLWMLCICKLKQITSFSCKALHTPSHFHRSLQLIRSKVSLLFGSTTLSHRWGVGKPLPRDNERRRIYDLKGMEGLAKVLPFLPLTWFLLGIKRYLLHR